jgi:penicillin-binding protein 2
MDPNTGKVLAMASYPTYDLTRFDSQEYVDWLNRNGNNPWLNRSLQGVYAPGSTYKIGAALAALEQETIDESTRISCDGVFHKYDNPTCLGSHGATDVIGAIRDSCNIFFYHLGDLMGVDKLTDYTARLGLGQDTGLELFNQKGSIAMQNANPGDTVRSAIGQSDHGYTPLQLSVYMSTIVNGGTRYSATLLDSVRKYYTKEIVEQTQTKIIEQVEFSDHTYQVLLEGMSQVVSENATVSRYFTRVPVAVGGKTGTAEVTGKVDYALFCGFAPLEKPEIVVSCVIEEGQHGYYAASAAGKVMEKYFEKKSARAEEN